MVIWDPWHRLEYHRIHGKGRQEHAYTESVEDNGWKLLITGMTREQWFVTYTRVCAEDYLARKNAPSGDYVIAVYRTGRSRDGDLVPLGSIRITFDPTRVTDDVAGSGDPWYVILIGGVKLPGYTIG